jgi:hypothetical protein
VEERHSHLFGNEIKWGKAKPRKSKKWLSAYPEAKNPLEMVGFLLLLVQRNLL